jgi:hypothetical protein
MYIFFYRVIQATNQYFPLQNIISSKIIWDILNYCLQVHRTCLNDWRAFSPNPTSFTNCDVCGFKYELIEREEFRTNRMWKFVLYVARDFIGSMIFIQAIVVLFSVIIYFADPGKALLKYFPLHWNKFGVYYIWGLFLFSVIVSIYGASLLLYKCCGKQSYNHSPMTYDTYPYFWGPYFYWFYYPSGYSCCPICYCPGSAHGCGACMVAFQACSNSVHCGNNSNSNNAITILGLIVMAVAITVGFVMMVVIAAIVLKRHASLLQKRQDAREMEVVDLEEQKLDIASI